MSTTGALPPPSQDRTEYTGLSHNGGIMTNSSIPCEPLEPRRFYSVSETARLLGVSAMTIYRSIANNELPAIRIRNRLIVPAKYVDHMAETAIQRGALTTAADVVSEVASP